MTVGPDYYNNVYCGAEYDDIDRLLSRAGDIIDSMITVDIINDFQLESYKKAVCAEAEFIGLSGGAEELNDSSSSSFSVGKFSVTSGGNSSSGISSKIAKTSLMYLEKAGLLYRGLA